MKEYLSFSEGKRRLNVEKYLLTLRVNITKRDVLIVAIESLVQLAFIGMPTGIVDWWLHARIDRLNPESSLLERLKSAALSRWELPLLVPLAAIVFVALLAALRWV